MLYAIGYIIGVFLGVGQMAIAISSKKDPVKWDDVEASYREMTPDEIHAGLTEMMSRDGR